MQIHELVLKKQFILLEGRQGERFRRIRAWRGSVSEESGPDSSEKMFRSVSAWLKKKFPKKIISVPSHTQSKLLFSK